MRAVAPEVNPTRRAGMWPLWFAVLQTALVCAASALTLAVALATHAWPRYAGPLALAAFVLGGCAWLARGATFAARGPRLLARASRGVAAARWMFLILFFPLPGWLLGWGGGSSASFWTAFALQFAGLLAERRVSFAEARFAQDQARSARP